MAHGGNRWTLIVGLFLALFVAFTMPVVANPAPSPDNLAPIEQNLLNRTYPNDPTADRLSRLEAVIFGASNPTASIQDRIAALSAVVSKNTTPPDVSSIPSPNPPTYGNKPALDENQPNGNQPNDDDAMLPKRLPGESDYPIVTLMENKVFGKGSPTDPLADRINRLEAKVFGHSGQGAMSDRVDRLRMSVLGPDMPDNEETTQGDPSFAPSHGYPQSNPPPPNFQAQNPQTQNDVSPANLQAMQYQVEALERKYFKQTYPQDSLGNRLDRLEYQVFKVNAPELTSQARLERLTAVGDAKDTAPTSASSQRKIQMGVTTGMMILMILGMFL